MQVNNGFDLNWSSICLRRTAPRKNILDTTLGWMLSLALLTID